MSAMDSVPDNELQKTILGRLQDGVLNFDSTFLKVPDLTTVLDEVFGTHQFNVAQAVAARESDHLMLSGMVSLLRIERVGLRIVVTNGSESGISLYFRPIPPADWDLSGIFAPSNKSPLQYLPLTHSELAVICAESANQPTRIKMSGGLAEMKIDGVCLERNWQGKDCTINWKAPEKIQLPGIGSVSLDDFSFTVNVSLDEPTFNGAIGGNIHAGSLVLPLIMVLPSGGEALQLRGDFEPIPLKGLAAAADLFGMDAAAMNIPTDLAKLDNLVLSDLEILLNPRSAEIIYLSLKLQSTATWPVLPEIAALENIQLGFDLFSPVGNERSFLGDIRGDIKLAGLSIAMRAEIDRIMSLYGHIPAVPLKSIGRSLIPIDSFWTLLPECTLEDVVISLSSSGDFELSASGVNLDLTTTTDTMGIPLPGSISNISLNLLAISHIVQDGLSRVDIASNGVFLFDPEAKDGLTVSHVSIGVEHQSTGTGLDCSFQIDGTISVSEELSLLFQNVVFSWDQTVNHWSVEGSAHANILGTEYPLVVAVELQGDTRSISLHYPADLPLTDLSGAGLVVIHDFTLLAAKTGKGTEKAARWQLSGGARITVDHLFEAEGTLFLQNDGEKDSLELSAKAPSLPPILLPLGFPDDPELQLSLDDITITCMTETGGKATWSLTSKAHLQISSIPPLLEKYLPSESLSGQFFAGGKTVGIGFDVTLQPEFPELALTFANDYELSLGRPSLSVTGIELQLGEQPRLVQKFRVSLPRELNKIFSVDKNKQPNVDLFVNEFELHLILAERLGLSVATSPFKPLTFYTREGDDGQWTKWNHGPVGTVEFRVPEFVFQGGRWKASCGFNRLTPLNLPLRPVRFLLEKCGFPNELTKIIPRSIPLKDVDLTGDNFSREMKALLGDEVLGRLDSKASALLNELFDAVKKVIDRLPTRLQEYLKIRIPESMLMEISIDSAGGGTSLALRTLADDPPLNFLFPLMLGIPELVGMSLRGLSFGQKMGGSLALIEFDGDIDRFDMVALIGAMALGEKNSANHYTLHNTLFVLPTAFPVLIPLFFTDLGLDYCDILGFNIQARWSYPDPQLDIFKTINLFSELIQFFKNPDYLLQNNDFGKTLRLELTIGKNFITLPQYLGGNILGLQRALPTLSVGDSVAHFLDFLKTGNAGYAITAIPLEYQGEWIRIGSEEIHFGPLVIGMSWCITTEQEFVERIIPASRQNDRLPVSFDNRLLESLPRQESAGSFSKGFIILLMGHTGIGNIAGLRTEFGIAVTRRGGFETGFRLSGEIGGTLALRIRGAILANGKKVTIKGSTGIFRHDQPLISSSGVVTVTDTSLEVIITIELGPSFSLTGLFIVGRQGLLLDGKAAWRHGADGPSEGIGASVQFDRDGMVIVFAWSLAGLDGEVRIQVPGDGSDKLFSAAVLLQPGMALQEAFAREIKALAKSTAEETVDRVYNDLQNAFGVLDSLELSIAGLRNWLPSLCDDIIATINKNIEANTTGWKKPGRTSARNQAKSYINRLATLRDIARNAAEKTIRKELKAALQEIIEHNTLNITVGIPSVKWERKGWIRYPVYYTRRVSIYARKLMDENQLNKLQQGVDWIDKLPDANGALIRTQILYDQLPSRDKLLGEVYRDIENGVDDAVPKVESIGFATALGVLEVDRIEAIIAYRRGGKEYHEKITLDFSDPAQIIAQLVDAFGIG